MVIQTIKKSANIIELYVKSPYIHLVFGPPFYHEPIFQPQINNT